ncbi:MAG TPA: Hsp20/alpha crystallin family protein [Polyangia bacterium]|nr:Hsp20/alpha crystallin family protein [Polyangia bacterium]
MHRQTFELMHDQVRAIFRAATGAELPTVERRGNAPAGADLAEVVARRFAELESVARFVPGLAERLPPFAFAPLADVIESDKEFLVEIALPGVARDDVHVELRDAMLEVSGVRRGPSTDGHGYRHAEIPRGPFRRSLLLPPEAASGAPRIDVENGVVRIHLAKLPMQSVAKA